MIVILAPAVADSLVGAPAGAKFFERLWMFLLATVYAMATVYVFDAFSRQRDRGNSAAA